MKIYFYSVSVYNHLKNELTINEVKCSTSKKEFLNDVIWQLTLFSNEYFVGTHNEKELNLSIQTKDDERIYRTIKVNCWCEDKFVSHNILDTIKKFENDETLYNKGLWYINKKELQYLLTETQIF